MPMKRMLHILSYVLFALVGLFPFGKVLGYTVEVVNFPAYAVITAAISVDFLFFSMKTEELGKDGVIKVLLAVLTPISMINTIVWIQESDSKLVVICGLICSVCCLILTLKYGKPLALKIIALILSALLAAPVGFFSLFALTIGKFGQETVVKTLPSPNGNYYAEVIDSDQGALGGDTLVEVYSNQKIDLLVIKFSPKPQRVYLGEWGAYKTMDIYWKGDSCLVINSVEYAVK